MEFSRLINERCSIRKYASGITREELEPILRQAQRAPSWKNQQTSRCYAVTYTEMLEELREAALPLGNRNNSANAALIVSTFVKDVVGFNNGVPANEVGNGWGAYDLGLRDAFLVLAARNSGFDTLIMGIRDAEAIRQKLGIPENEVIMSVIAIGKRDAEPALRPRKELEEVARFI